MDLRKLKTLIDLVSESNVSELEITEAEGKVRIVKGGGAVVLQLVAAPVVAAQPAAAAVAAAPAAAFGCSGFFSISNAELVAAESSIPVAMTVILHSS